MATAINSQCGDECCVMKSGYVRSPARLTLQVQPTPISYCLQCDHLEPLAEKE